MGESRDLRDQSINHLNSNSIQLTMSKTRIALNLFLVVVLIAVCVVGYYVMFVINSPGYHWNQAQAAMAADDPSAAEISLKNLVEKDPAHFEGHLALAEILKVKESGRYATSPGALSHLARAGELKPDDNKIQRDLLNAYLGKRQMTEAAIIADRLIKDNPKDSDTLFTLAWRSVKAKQHAKSDEYFQRLSEVKSLRPFQILGLMAQSFQDRAGKESEEQLAGVFQRLDKTAESVDAKTLAMLSNRELQTMEELFRVAVAKSPDAATAHKHLHALMAGMDKLVAEKRRKPLEAAKPVAECLLAMRAKFPVDEQPTVVQQERKKVVLKADGILESAIAAGGAAPVVYHQHAVNAFRTSDTATGVRALEEGIKAIQAQAKAGSGEKKETPADIQQRKTAMLELHLAAARQLVFDRDFANAELHIKPLLNEEESSGWGNLLAGAIDTEMGRHENALEHYLAARNLLGNSLIVRITLSNTFSKLKRWQDALQEQNALIAQYDSFSEEEAKWAKSQLGSKEKLRYDRLRSLLAMGEWKAAQPDIEALKKTPLEPKMWALAVAYLMSTGQEDAAKALLADARRKFPDDLALTQLEFNRLQKANDKVAAGNVLSRQAAISRDHLPTQLLFAQWKLKNEQYEDALKLLTSLEEKFTTPAQRTQIIALKTQVLYALKRPEEAIAAIATLPDDASAAAGVLKAAAALRADDPKAAAETINAAAEANPDSPSVALMQGQLAARQGDYEASIAALSKTLDVTDLKRRAHSAMFQSLMMLAKEKSPAVAETKIDELLAANPKNDVLTLAKSEMAFRQNRFDDGIAQLDTLQDRNPKSAQVPYLKSLAYLQKGRNAEALEATLAALKLSPDNAGLQTHAGKVCLRMKRNSDALDYAKAALALDGEQWEAYFVQADALFRLARKNEALKVLTALAKAQPKAPRTYVALAGIYASEKQPEKALTVYETAIRQLPGVQQFKLARISTLLRLERKEDATQAAKEFLGDKPTADKLLQLAQVYSARKQWDDAEQSATVAAERGNEDQQVLAWFVLGNLHMLKHQETKDRKYLEAAREEFAKVLELRPRHYVAGNNLAWLLAMEFEQPEEAVEVARRVRGDVSVEQLPLNFIDTLAAVYRKAGRTGDARKLIDEAAVFHPDTAVILFHKGMLAIDAKQTTQAKQSLEAALRLGLTGDQAARANDALSKLTP